MCDGHVTCSPHVSRETIFTISANAPTDTACIGFTGINYDCMAVSIPCPSGQTCLPAADVSIQVPCACSALENISNCSGFIAHVCSASETLSHTHLFKPTHQSLPPLPPLQALLPSLFPLLIPSPVGSSLPRCVWGQLSSSVFASHA